ncbi:lipopolysaccharide biosynthesis protein [bacterium]|nr:lipopolysaccharide biosynthesis protein [bacterium]
MPDKDEQAVDEAPAAASRRSGETALNRGLGREVLLYALSTVVAALCSFAGVYLFTRLLDPAEMGHYAIVMATVEILTNFGFGWINMTLLREYPAQSVEDRPDFIGRIVAAQILVSGLIGLVTALYCLSAPLSHVDWTSAIGALVLVIFQAALSFTQWVFRVQRRALDWALSGMLVALSKLGLGWLLLKYWQASGDVLVLSQGAATFISAVAAMLRWKEPVRLSADSFRLRAIQPILRYGAPLTLVGAAQNLLNRSGLLILGLFRSKAEIGIYYQAYQLTMNLLQLPYQPLDMASSPASYQVLEREGPRAAGLYMYRYTALVLQVLAAVGLSIYLLRDAVVGSVLDPAYAAAADYLVYLLPALTLVYLQSQLRRGFEFGRATGELGWYILAAVALNIGLNFALAPSLGAVGVALASLITYALYGSALYMGGSRHVPWPLPWKPALCLLPAAALLIGLHRVLPYPAGLPLTIATGLLYTLLFMATSTASLLLAGGEGRAQLRFLADLLRSRTS